MSELHSQRLPAHLLHSSVVPCESDRTLVQESIRQSKRSLSEVDEELQKLKAQVADLECRRSRLEEGLAHKQGILSSLRRLPPEILEEIFLNITPAPLFWRSIYLSLPRLWSTFHFDLSGVVNPGAQLQNSIAGLLQTCLQRSGTELLRFTFQSQCSHVHSGQMNLYFDDLSRSLLTTLVEASSRWCEVNLSLDDLFMCSDALSLAKGRVPFLQSLRLVSKTTPIAALSRQAIDAFSDAPRLVKLSLQDVIYPTSYLRIPWSQLRYLNSKGCTFFEGEFSTILRDTHLLEEFSTEDEPSNDSTRPSNFISLPNLRSLKVVSKSSYINRIFQLFTTPTLTLPHILAMLQRSSACHHIQVLEIETSKDPEASWSENLGILSLLRAMDGVERCTLKVYHSAKTILPTLGIRGAKDWDERSYLRFEQQLVGLREHVRPCSRSWTLERHCKSKRGQRRAFGDCGLEPLSTKPPDLQLDEIVELAARSGTKLDLSLSM
ncbi:hypothetical protein BKA70DRAFT_1295843 [Coprinopsis sp. MPI-PUGE-AT-0042]|nr:hypothetical protein BKA70DRAFT_1295843 [Coprinopsis sp. MPI-PUGE-AT-0042]